MAFITMPAPKIGAKFYDKPGNRRTLFMLKRLQDGKVVCAPANDTSKESLIMPIPDWEKLTGYTVGPDLLALMTFSSPKPAPTVAEPAKAKPATKKATKASKNKATEAPAAAPAAPPTAISPDFAHELVTLLRGQAVWMRLSGPSNAEARQEILRKLTGVKPPKNKAGINTVERVLCKKLGIDEKTITYRERDHQIIARLREIAGDSNSEPAPAAPTPQLAPAEIVTVGDGVELVVQPLRAATPAEVATAAIVKPEVPTDAQPLVVKISQILCPNGDPGDLTQIDPQRLQAMVANIKAKKAQDNGDIVVEMYAPDPQCAFGKSQHGPATLYKIVAGHEQLQAITHFLEQNGAPGPIGNYQIRVRFTEPAEPALANQEIEQAITDGVNAFTEPITFTQPEEPEALDAEDYDEQGRLRPSAMNKKQVQEAIAELVANGWRLVTKRDMGSTKMRLVHEEKRIASYPGNSERFLLIAMRTKMYGPSAKYFQDWLNEEGVQPPTPTAPADIWQQAADEGSDAANLIEVMAKDGAAWWQKETAKADAPDAAIQPTVETQPETRIEVSVKDFTYNDDSWDVPDSRLKPIMLNLGEYGPQATDITACASGLRPGKYLVITGAEYITAAVRLKWETVPITLVEMPCEPIIEEYRAEYVGHNADGQALYADKHGVRTIYKRNGIAVTEPVHLIPTYGGIEYGVDRTYRPEYKTRAELEEEQGKATAVAATAAEPIIEAPVAAEPLQATAEPTVEEVIDEPVMPSHTAFHIGHNQNGKALYQATDGRRYYGWNEKTREWFREPQQRRQDPDTGMIVYETCRQQHTNFLTREELAQNPLPDERPVAIPEFHGVNARTTDRELASRLKDVDKKDKQLNARMNGAYELAINDGGASMRRIENEMRMVDFERDAIRNEQTRRLNAAKTAAARAAAAAPAPIQEIAAANPGRIIIASIPTHTNPVDKPATIASANPPGVLIDRVTLPAKAPAPTNEPLTQQIQVMGVGDQITEAGAAMLDEPQPKVHYDPGKVDLLFGLYPPKSYSAHHLVLLGDCTNLTFAPNRQQQLHVITAMLEQIGVNVTTLGAAPALVTTGRSVLATTGAQGIIGYQNDADYLNGEANRFNRTSGLIEANQFLTWRCNLEGFWRIHIAYDASDAYTVRMWRALDPLVSKALGEVVAEEKQVYLDDLHGVVEEMYYDCLKRFGYNGTPKWTPAINPNIPTASSRPAPRRRH